MRLMAIFAAGVLSVTSMGGIVTVHAGEALAVPADEAGVVQMDGEDVQVAEDGSVAASDGLIAESFKPSEIAQPAQDTYEYPFLGMKLGISKDLKEQMEKKNISMFTDERWDDNAEAVTYATASWCALTDEQKDAEVDRKIWIRLPDAQSIKNWAPAVTVNINIISAQTRMRMQTC